jgi:hypothetical protein
LAAFLTLATGPLVGLLLMLGVNEKRAELSTKMRS